MILMHDSPRSAAPDSSSWKSVREGGVRAHARPELYAYIDTHAEFDALFASAMDTVKALAGDSFITEFDWAPLGASSTSAAPRAPNRSPQAPRPLQALVADREQVPRCGAILATAGQGAVLQRMRYEACDVLQASPGRRATRTSTC